MVEEQLLKEARLRFARIRKKAKELGLSNEELIQLDVIKRHRNDVNLGKLFSKFILYSLLAAAVTSGLVYAGYKAGILTPRMGAEFIAKYVSYSDVEQDSCLIPYSESVLDIFRPPVDCDFCKDVHREDRVTNLTAENFKEKYAYSGRPVVITDGTKDWTAHKFFSFNFFRKVYKKGSPVLESSSKDCQFFKYNTDFNSVKEVFRMPKSMREMKGKSWYVGWSNCDSQAANTLRKYYSRPYFFSDEIESSKTDWIFMGTPGYGAHMHIDNVQYPSWQAQIRGTKIWTIEAPPECYYKCPSKFQIVVNPGDMIILDTNRWFHQTDIVGSNMSITIGSEYD